MKKASGSGGFFLVEALIALAILVLGATACCYGFSRNAKISHELNERFSRIGQAQALLLKAAL